jgi:hypothetical protein
MIKVKGEIRLRANFEVELDMTEEEFNNLKHWQQEDVISGEIDWKNWLDSSEVSDLDIDEIE